uniref:RRM domain-containing protein n=1 Tax=Euplotes crassus TaxID=5936 RepID=A0A7S3NY56_EUPCR|mmetsp:Transcript_34084/g.33629  ORF Transcript_34084/g.33629 Transcript_34084/m.33629 type:complete len:851 (+) Transcript_34084:8-2560(+)
MDAKKKELIENNTLAEQEHKKKQKREDPNISSRLIVFNVPKYFTEKKLADHFRAKGVVTDCKIMRKENKSRKFAFVGFKNERDAKAAREYFNDSYIDTSQITVEYAKTQQDPNLPRGWSKYTKGTMAYNRIHGEEARERRKPQSQIDSENKREVENKKKKFKEFLAVMMQKGKKVKNQSWNESFNDFVPTDQTKSRRQRKKEEKLRKEQKEFEKQEQEEEQEPGLRIENQEVTQKGKGITVIEKEIHKKSTKLGASKSKQVHIKFGEEADISQAAQKIEEIAEEIEEKPAETKVEEEDDEEIDENRLYCMNLPFTILEEDLRETFGKYGEIDEISIPKRRGGLGTGFCFIRFMEPESAVNAYANLDKKYYQGRKLTILPASKKKEKPEQEQRFEQGMDHPENTQNYEENKEMPQEERKEHFIDEKSSFKTKKKIHTKRNFDDETNWNYLFLSQDAVTEAIANKLSLKKGDILNKDEENMAVRVANIETQIIKETKEWMMENGINLKAIEGKNNRKELTRSKTMILIKNISSKVTYDELSTYAQTQDLIISPTNTLAIAKYKSASQAEAVMKKLTYYRLHNIPLYLEYAPQVFEKTSIRVNSGEDAQMTEDTSSKIPNTVFVKGLNFETSEQKLRELFESVKSGKILSTKIVKNKADGLQSQGYGFVEFETEEGAKTAMKKLQSCVLDDHMLKLKLAKRDTSEAEKKKRLEKMKRKEDESYVDNADLASTKLLVKNLAFEANKKDIKALFKEAGQVKKVRLPKKANSHEHRGFGFVEFVTIEDARNAFETLQHSHLYGRKLVIQWAKNTDDINNLKDLRNKASYQQETLKSRGDGNNKRRKLKEGPTEDDN